MTDTQQCAGKRGRQCGYVGVSKTPGGDLLAMLKPGGQLKRQLIAYRTEGGGITAPLALRGCIRTGTTDDTVIPDSRPPRGF